VEFVAVRLELEVWVLRVASIVNRMRKTVVIEGLYDGRLIRIEGDVRAGEIEPNRSGGDAGEETEAVRDRIAGVKTDRLVAGNTQTGDIARAGASRAQVLGGHARLTVPCANAGVG